jgi:uncharacterized membrane protein
MEKLHSITLYIHIAAGMTAFIAAPVAMIVKKGGDAHRKWGKVYFWCMTVIAITGIVLSIMLPNLFLFCIAFFSYYMVVSGYRWLYNKKPGQKTARIDWIITGIASVFNLGLFIIGIIMFFRNSQNAFGYISAVFGLIGLNFAYKNVKQFSNVNRPKQSWLYNHIGGMIGGYIATVSAFSAVNFHFLPPLIKWLWPTIIGVPVIYAWIAYYRKKINKGKEAKDLVEIKINTL